MNDKFDNIHVDITFNNKNHMGLKCSEMIKSFMQAEPLLRPLVLVIKVLVNAYDISDPYKGGLSSYAITLMVIALLQVRILRICSLHKSQKRLWIMWGSSYSISCTFTENKLITLVKLSSFMLWGCSESSPSTASIGFPTSL